MKTHANPNPNPREVTATESAVLEAERVFEKTKAEHDAEQREMWRVKAQEIAKEARQALSAFRAAKANFASASADDERLRRQAAQLRLDLHELEVEYKLLEFPLDDETEAFEREKKRLLSKLDAFRDPLLDVARRKGAAITEQTREAAKVEQLRFAHANALAKSRGERLGVIEGGVRFVS